MSPVGLSRIGLVQRIHLKTSTLASALETLHTLMGELWLGVDGIQVTAQPVVRGATRAEGSSGFRVHEASGVFLCSPMHLSPPSCETIREEKLAEMSCTLAGDLQAPH